MTIPRAVMYKGAKYVLADTTLMKAQYKGKDKPTATYGDWCIHQYKANFGPAVAVVHKPSLHIAEIYFGADRLKKATKKAKDLHHSFPPGSLTPGGPVRGQSDQVWMRRTSAVNH